MPRLFGRGENGRLTKVYFDIICRCRPDFFLFENVRGLVKTEKHRAFYNEMMMKVQANDYLIAEKVLNSKLCSAEHNAL